MDKISIKGMINEKIKLLYKDILFIYDLYPLICNEVKEKCHSITKSGKKIFYDYGHLTLDGSRYIGEILFKKNFSNEFLN